MQPQPTAPTAAPRLRVISGEIPPAEIHAGLSLGQFYELFYLPRVARALRRHQPGTVQLYRDALAWWAKLTGDPPLRDVDRDLLGQFVAELCEPLADSTARKHLGNLNRIFARTAGRFGTTVELLPEAPRFELPLPPPADVADCWTPAEIRQLIDAAQRMRTPKLEQSADAPAPLEWWASFVAVAYLHGFRCGTMLLLHSDDLVDGHWRIPAHKVKGRRKGLIGQLHPEAAQILRGRRGPLWPWYAGRHSRRFFHRQVERLVRLAGLPDARAFGTHALRRAHATGLAETNPEHARLSLGHSLFATTAAHYINAAVAGKAAQGLSIKG